MIHPLNTLHALKAELLARLAESLAPYTQAATAIGVIGKITTLEAQVEGLELTDGITSREITELRGQIADLRVRVDEFLGVTPVVDDQNGQ